MKIKSVLLFVVLLFFLVGCALSTPAPVGSGDATVCVRPESDNDYSWSYDSCVVINTQVYTIDVKVLDMESHTEVNASGQMSGSMYGGYGYASGSYRMWQDGKGLLTVEVVSISPSFHDILPGDTIVLKTTDLKAMGLPNGSTTKFLCNEDTETISPNITSQTLTEDRLTYELDDCRMFTSEYK